MRNVAPVLAGWLLAVGVCVAQSSAPAQKVNLDGFDAEISKAMETWKVPGVSMAIVQDGKVIFARGFGYRDVEKKLPVTTDTLFAIGSISKSFTSLVFATLNDEGTVDWDKPVRTYLPTFQVDDPIATDHATPRDFMSHRTGLPGHDLLWYTSTFSREDLFHRLRYLKSNKEFRSGYEYCNLMFMAMGYLEGQITSSTWEDQVRLRVFQPLEMPASDFSVVDMQKSADFAQPYELKKNVLTKVPFKNIDPIGPAGSINSSINEMSHYLAFHLGDGTYKGKRVVSQSNLKMLHTGQTAITSLPEFFSQQGLGPMVYALGWVDTTYRGHHMVWHNGGIDGFHSLLTMLPDDKIGVVILSNLGGSEALEPMAYSAFDRVLGLDRKPWIEQYKELHDKNKKQEEEGKKKKVLNAKAGTQASHPLSEFAGEYVHPGYGTLKIAPQGDALEISFNQMGPYPFARVHYDIFEIPEDAEPAGGTRGQFYMNRDGDIDRLAMPLEQSLPEDIVFTRAAEKLSKEALESLAGDYLLGSSTATVSVAGETLRIAVPGDKDYDLVPVRGLKFDVKGLSGYSIEFKKGTSGRTVELLLASPGGAMVGKKK